MRFVAVNEAASFRAVDDPASTSEKIMQNLLVHIPGEASAAYLMTIPLVKDDKDQIILWLAVVIGVLALGLLVVVRWLANATKAVHITSIIAFVIWMMAFDQGFLNLLFDEAGFATAGVLGLVLSVFYTALITALGSAGKLK
jgi:hypothetical protein